MIFHALNGLRIIAVDFWAKGPRVPATALLGVVGVGFVVLFVPFADPAPDHRVHALRGGGTHERHHRDQLPAGPDAVAAKKSATAAPRARQLRAQAGSSCAPPACCCSCSSSGTCSSTSCWARASTAIDFAFVAGKWANPFWQVWDLRCSGSPMLHGFNGLRTIINDYT